MKKRSVGVTIFAILFIVGALLSLISTVTTPKALHAMLDAPGMTAESKTQMQTTLQLFQSRVWLILGQAVAGLAAGVGLLMLQGWARWLTILLAGLNIVQVVVSLVTQGGLGGGAAGAVALVALLFSLAWSGLLIWFFLQSSIKAQFEKTVTSG